MNLWLSSCFLVAGLFLSSSALTPEECQPLITPLPMTPSVVYGKSHFLFGYSQNEVSKDLLKNTESDWVKIDASTSSPDAMVMTSATKINGSCLSFTMNGTIDGNTASASFGNFTSVFHLLPTCDGCLLMSVNSTATDMDKMFKLMNINIKVTAEKIYDRALYLSANGTTVKDSDLEQLKKQASCLGFTGEPDFIYDPKNGLCAEGEGHEITEHH